MLEVSTEWVITMWQLCSKDCTKINYYIEVKYIPIKHIMCIDIAYALSVVLVLPASALHWISNNCGPSSFCWCLAHDTETLSWIYLIFLVKIYISYFFTWVFNLVSFLFNIPHLIKFPTPRLDIKRSCTCVLWVYILPLYSNLFLYNLCERLSTNKWYRVVSHDSEIELHIRKHH
jgi:hypothetical protein